MLFYFVIKFFPPQIERRRDGSHASSKSETKNFCKGKLVIIRKKKSDVVGDSFPEPIPKNCHLV